jgi:hypothetical protein
MQRKHRRPGLVLVALLAGLNSNAVWAQAFATHSVREAISLQSGATCLNTDRLADSVKQLLSSDALDSRIAVDVQGDPVLASSVSIIIWRANQAYATRRFDDAPQDCDQLHKLVALAIAFAIDATWLDKREIAKKPLDKPAEKPPEEPERPSDFRGWALGIDVVATGGAVLGPGFGWDLRAELGLVSWLEIRGSALGIYSYMQPIRNSSGSVDSFLHAARVDGCVGAHLLPWLKPRACLGGAIGAYTTQGRNFSPHITDTTLWMAGVAGIEFLFTVAEKIELVFSIDSFFPVGQRIIQVLDLQNEPIGAEENLTRAAVVVRAGPLFLF